MVLNPTVKPLAQSQAAQFHHGARGQAVAAGFVPRELAGVDHQDVLAGARRPSRRGRTRRPRPDDENVCAESLPRPMCCWHLR